MSKAPHDPKRYELLRLVETCLEKARYILMKQQSFLPAFIAVEPNGKYHFGVAALGGADGSNLLVKALRQKAAAEHLRAAAIYRDVRVRPKGASEDVDAIQIVAELATGESVNGFQVYRMNKGEPVFYDAPVVEEVPSVIFAHSHEARSKRWWEVWK